MNRELIIEEIDGRLRDARIRLQSHLNSPDDRAEYRARIVGRRIAELESARAFIETHELKYAQIDANPINGFMTYINIATSASLQRLYVK